MKSAVAGAKGKKQSKTGAPTKTPSKFAKAERKAERKVAELRALLVKAEKKLAKHAARAAGVVSEAITKHDASVESPPMPVAIKSSTTKDDAAPASTPYQGERETPPSVSAPKRSAARSIKSGTTPAPPAKRTAPNHTSRKGNQIEAPAPSEKEGGDE